MLQWTAIYKDRSELHQYEQLEDGSNKENAFSKINQEELLGFRVDDGNRHIVVDMTNGLFAINNTVFVHKDTVNLVDYKLVYYRRVKKTIGTGNTNTGSETYHFVGYQVNIDDKAVKKIYGINEAGLIMPEEN